MTDNVVESVKMVAECSTGGSYGPTTAGSAEPGIVLFLIALSLILRCCRGGFLIDILSRMSTGQLNLAGLRIIHVV